MTVTLRRLVAGTGRVDTIMIVSITVVALLARVFVAITVPESAPVHDMKEYWDRAVFIFEHGRLYDNSWRMPGYPAALALAFAVGSGPSLRAAYVLNAILGTAAVLLTYCLARRTAGPRPAVVAAIAIALYPSFLVYTAFVATETIVTFPIVAALLAASYPTGRAAVVAGACAALAALVRPAGIALLPAVLIGVGYVRGRNDGRRWNLRRPTLAIVGFAIIMAPWWFHNARLYARFIPLDTGGGINLLIGNGPFASGLWESRVFPQMEAMNLQGLDWKTPAGSDATTALAISEIEARPLDALRRIPVKVRGLFALEGREQGYLYSWSYFGPLRSVVVWLWGVPILVAFPMLLVAAIAGCAVHGGLEAEVFLSGLMFLLATVAMHVVFFGDSRYHLPMVPVLAVLTTGLARWRKGISRWRLAAGVLIVLWLAVSWLNQYATFLNVLPTLAGPDGWKSYLIYDDLL